MSRIVSPPPLGRLCQGLIFEGLKVKDVYGFGVIITADCDIAQEKVMDAHYLTIVSLKDYLCNFVCSGIVDEQMRNIAKNIHNLDIEYVKLCIRAGKGTDLINFKNPKLLSILEFLSHGCTKSECFIKKEISSGLKAKLKELIGDRQAGLYFMDDIGNNDNSGYIINFNDIRPISLKFAKLIAIGLEKNKYEDKYSELYYFSDFVMPIGVMTSPQREHFMQRFSQHFVRIGLEDRDINSLDFIIDAL